MPQYIVDHMKIELKQLQNHIDEMTVLSRSRWYYELSYKIHDMNMSSLVAWESFYILKVVDKSHHNNTNNMIMKKEDGTMVDNYKDNMRVMHPHFQKVFNNHQPTDFRLLELIKKRKKKCGTLMIL